MRDDKQLSDLPREPLSSGSDLLLTFGAKMALENLSKKKNTAEKIKETEAVLMARRRQEKQQSSMAIIYIHFPYMYGVKKCSF